MRDQSRFLRDSDLDRKDTHKDESDALLRAPGTYDVLEMWMMDTNVQGVGTKLGLH